LFIYLFMKLMGVTGDDFP